MWISGVAVSQLCGQIQIVGLVVSWETGATVGSGRCFGGWFYPVVSDAFVLRAFAFVRDEIVRFHRSISGRLCGSRL